jgi:hypothetical protein
MHLFRDYLLLDLINIIVDYMDLNTFKKSMPIDNKIFNSKTLRLKITQDIPIDHLEQFTNSYNYSSDECRGTSLNIHPLLHTAEVLRLAVTSGLESVYENEMEEYTTNELIWSKMAEECDSAREYVSAGLNYYLNSDEDLNNYYEEHTKNDSDHENDKQKYNSYHWENFIRKAYTKLKEADPTVYDHMHPCLIAEKMVQYIKKELGI